MIDRSQKTTRIRLAADEDFEAVYSIWLEGIANSFDASEYDASVLRKNFRRNFDLRKGVFNFWVATDEAGSILGWQSLIQTSHNPMRLDEFAESSTYVCKTARTSGIGKSLLENAVREAEKSDLKYLIGFISVTNEASRKMAENGWTELGKIPLPKNAGNQPQKIIVIRPV